jgi:hypothetical protein
MIIWQDKHFAFTNGIIIFNNKKRVFFIELPRKINFVGNWLEIVEHINK